MDNTEIEFLETLASNLPTIREYLFATQEDFADQINVSRSTLLNIENRKIPLSRNLALNIFKRVKLTIFCMHRGSNFVRMSSSQIKKVKKILKQELADNEKLARAYGLKISRENNRIPDIINLLANDFKDLEYLIETGKSILNEIKQIPHSHEYDDMNFKKFFISYRDYFIKRMHKLFGLENYSIDLNFEEFFYKLGYKDESISLSVEYSDHFQNVLNTADCIKERINALLSLSNKINLDNKPQSPTYKEDFSEFLKNSISNLYFILDSALYEISDIIQNVVEYKTLYPKNITTTQKNQCLDWLKRCKENYEIGDADSRHNTEIHIIYRDSKDKTNCDCNRQAKKLLDNFDKTNCDCFGQAKELFDNQEENDGLCKSKVSISKDKTEDEAE